MRDAIRSFLGVWAPLLLGAVLIAMAVNFLLTSRGGTPDPNFPLDPIASAACGAGLILVGAVLILSTIGRWRKVRKARAAAP